MKKRSRDPKPLLPALASATGPALIKHLASCNNTVRSQSLRLIHSWLASQTQDLSDSHIKRLWKGLFYCLWHADKTPNQVALIDRLTSLFLSLQPSVSLEFFRGFLLTLRREWPGIDRLRLDKFYLLIRRFMKALFELMRLRNWDADVLGEYFGVLETDGLLAADKLQGNGVNYQVVSVFLEELKSVGFPVRKEVLDVIVRPFFAVVMRGEDKILLGKVKSCLFDELLNMGRELLGKKKMGVDCDENDGDKLLGVVALRMELSGKFYEVGSSVDCIQGNRKVALGLRDEFLKLEKDLESSGIEISIPEYSYVNQNGGDDEIPQLIPIDFDENKSNVDDGISEEAEVTSSKNRFEIGISKKSKKVKKGMDGDDKKTKKKKKKKGEDALLEIKSAVEENGNPVEINITDNLQSPSGFEINPTNELENDETVISNLQKQFEKVAAEMGSETDKNSISSDIPLIPSKKGKRKRIKGSSDAQDSSNPRINTAQDSTNPSTNTNGTTYDRVESAAKSVDKSAKRVRFSMKNNLVWKPQNPLPPESLRLPPSVTPRGSALKKGLTPGPIVEMQPVLKKAKQKKRKKAQNRLQNGTSSMVMKQQRKIQP